MDGDIVYPGDLHGRVLPADRIDLAWDGNLICALVGPDLVVGVSGFGDSVHAALRDLADNLIKEAVWINVPHQNGLNSPQSRPGFSGTIQADFVELRRAEADRVCALIADDNYRNAVFGIGESVHVAIRGLADQLTAAGVWVEVSARNEWHFEEVSELLHGLDSGSDDQAEPETRPLPDPPRCRGIHLGDGEYAGCQYGYGDLTPLTGSCDCPVCHGSGFEGVVGTTLPHADFGDPDCCGCLNGVIRGDQADIVCNECDAVVRSVPAADLQQTLTELELSLDLCTEMCPHCGAASVFPGFSAMLAFTCQHCGKPVRLSDDPNTERALPEV